MEDAQYGLNPIEPETVRLRPPTQEQHAREKYKLPSDWQAYSWEAKGDDRETGWTVLKGGVYRHKRERGERKGEADFRKPEPGTEATLSLANAEHEAWLAQWQVDTGHCSRCRGTGHAFSGWDHKKGTAYRPCTKCNATGLCPPATDKAA